MDRSFLSDEKVIAATRDFVCLRLATYEDSEEAKFLGKIYKQRGYLANTVFGILAPDGETLLVRPGRKPSFRRASQLAARMNQIVSEDYGHAMQKRWSDETLPEMKSLDLAINVASCDGLPMIVAVGNEEAEVKAMRHNLMPIAWSDEFAGQFVFATTSGDGLKAITGLDDEDPSGIYFVEPDTFGVSGRVTAKLDSVSTSEGREQISSLLREFQVPVKNHRQHVQAGYQFGLKWQTAIPVTDKQAAQAAKRLWGSGK